MAFLIVAIWFHKSTFEPSYYEQINNHTAQERVAMEFYFMKGDSNMKTMKFRTMYQLKASQGAVIPCSDYATAILAAAQTAIPTKAIDVFDDSILVDMLTGDEVVALEKAISDIPGMNAQGLLELYTAVCDLDGKEVDEDQFYKLAAEENRLAREAFDAKYGPDFDEDDVDEWED